MIRATFLLAVGCLLGGSGCFYVDRINQRPSLDIEAASKDAPFRGDTVSYKAISNDPDGNFVAFQWRMYSCTDASLADPFVDPAAGCDHDPFDTSVLTEVSFAVPVRRADGRPTESILIVLEGKDDLGAAAKPSQHLVVPVLNRPPELELRITSRYAYVLGTPIDVFAKVGDLDDSRDHVSLTWTVFAPSAVSHTLTDLAIATQDDPLTLTYGKRFTPLGVGTWDLQVTATDPLGNTTLKEVMIPVAGDKPPCLAQLAPIVPTAGARLPLTEATLFSAPVVIDDLDVYPPVANDPVLGTTRFVWSIQGPSGGVHVPVGATSNSIVVDPASYTPGDQIEVRVEVFDRNSPVGSTLPCSDGDPTCSIATPQTCLQRQTWKVEIR